MGYGILGASIHLGETDTRFVRHEYWIIAKTVFSRRSHGNGAIHTAFEYIFAVIHAEGDYGGEMSLSVGLILHILKK